MVADVKTSKVVRTLRHGQITIPAEFRRALGIEDETLLRVTLSEGGLRLEPVEEVSPNEWFRQLYDYFAPVREEILARGISEEEVNADIDAAIAAARAARD